MSDDKRAALEAAGYKFGDAEDFPRLNQDEREMAAKKLADKHKIPESYVRQMLAIGRGESIDDVIEVGPRIKMKSFSGYPGACPAQWECVSESEVEIYIRYRGGRLRVYAPFPDLLCEMQIGGRLDGRMTTADMQSHAAVVLDWSNATREDD